MPDNTKIIESGESTPVQGVMLKFNNQPYWVLARDDGWQLMTPTIASMLTFFIPEQVGRDMVKVPLSVSTEVATTPKQ